MAAALRELEKPEVQKLLLEMDDMTQRYHVGYCVLVAFIFLFNTVLYVTFIFMKSSMKRDLANILLLNQTFSDIIVGVAVLLQSVHTNDYSDDLHLGRCALFFLHYSYYLSCNCLLLNAFERMLAFNFPRTHAKIFSSVGKLVVIIFVVYVLSSIPPICHSAYVDVKAREEYSTYMTVFFVLLLVTILAVYSFSIVTCVAVHKKGSVLSNEMEMHGKSDETNGGELKVAEKSYIGLFLAHSIFFAISYLPIAIVVIIDISGGSGLVVEHWLAVVIVYMLSAIFNPIITLIFKDDYTNTLMCKKSKQQEGEHEEVVQNPYA